MSNFDKGNNSEKVRIASGTPVDRFFQHRMREIRMSTGGNSSSDEDAQRGIAALESMQKVLKRVERSSPEKPVELKNVSGVLAQLGSEMVSPKVGDDEIDKNTELSHDIFLMAGDKLFGPESVTHPSDLPDKMYSMADRANKLGMPKVGDFLASMREVNLASAIKKPNGVEVVAKMQEDMMSALWGGITNEGDVKNYNGEIDGVDYTQEVGDGKMADERDAFLGELMKDFYSLEKIKQQLQEKKSSEESEDRKQKLTQREAQLKEADRQQEAEVREKMLLNSIVVNGSVAVTSSWPSGLKFAGGNGLNGSGFQQVLDRGNSYKPDSKLLNESAPGRRVLSEVEAKLYPFGGTSGFRMADLSINESVVISPAVEKVQREVVEHVKVDGVKGFLGATKEVRKMVETGEERHLGQNDLVQNGKQEPAYFFRYVAKEFGDQRFYKDKSGRAGQMLNIECVLPESVIKELIPKLESDPKFVRKVVEELMLRRTGLPENIWVGDPNNQGVGIKPPYEAWAQSMGGKSKMYVNLAETSKNYTDKTGKIVDL